MLEVDRLTVRFGGLVAVQDLTFTVRPNEILSLIGPNGAGKTTVFNAITGFCSVSEGSVNLRGQRITGLSVHEVAERGVVRTFQKTNVFREMRVHENVLTASHRILRSGFWRILAGSPLTRREEMSARRRVKDILAFCGLADHGDRLAGDLSYGEQRLLEIAIALAAEPELLLLDEPAAGLNPVEAERLMTLIRKIRDLGKTVVLVEHYMKLVMAISDRIEVINYGRKIAEGPPQVIANNEEVIQAYLGKRSVSREASRAPV